MPDNFQNLKIKATIDNTPEGCPNVRLATWIIDDAASEIESSNRRSQDYK